MVNDKLFKLVLKPGTNDAFWQWVSNADLSQFFYRSGTNRSRFLVVLTFYVILCINVC